MDYAVDYTGSCDEDSDRSSDDDGDNAGPVTASQAGRVHAMGRCRWPLLLLHSDHLACQSTWRARPPQPASSARCTAAGRAPPVAWRRSTRRIPAPIGAA